jgi:hypothetical protein
MDSCMNCIGMQTNKQKHTHTHTPQHTKAQKHTQTHHTHTQRADKSFHLHKKTGGVGVWTQDPFLFWRSSGIPKWAIPVSHHSLENSWLVWYTFSMDLIFRWESIHTQLSSSCLKLCLQRMDGWINYIIQVPSTTQQGKACPMWFSYALT